MDSLNISTGAKHIAITRDGESVGELVFNPSDAVFAEKFYRLITEFETKFTEYETQLEGATQEETIALLSRTCTYVRERIDYLFGAGTSQLVFGDAMVMDAFGQFFDGIGQFFSTVRGEKIAKYTGKRSKRAL
jgi:hypothetical protein